MDWTFDITLKNRKIMAMFIKELSLEQLNKVPKGFNNNIIWNIAHLIATQQQLVYGLSGLPMYISSEFLLAYKKDSKPNGDVTQQGVDEINNLLFSTIEKTQEDYKKGVFKKYNAYTTSTNSKITSVEEAFQFNNFHEGIHLGYILALKKCL